MKLYKYILPLILIALLGSCENMDQEMSDDELIQAIIQFRESNFCNKKRSSQNCYIYSEF